MDPSEVNYVNMEVEEIRSLPRDKYNVFEDDFAIIAISINTVKRDVYDCHAAKITGTGFSRMNLGISLAQKEELSSLSNSSVSSAYDFLDVIITQTNIRVSSSTRARYLKI